MVKTKYNTNKKKKEKIGKYNKAYISGSLGSTFRPELINKLSSFWPLFNILFVFDNKDSLLYSLFSIQYSLAWNSLWLWFLFIGYISLMFLLLTKTSEYWTWLARSSDSDKIEPSRGYDSSKLIQAMMDDLDEGFVTVLRANIDYIHPKMKKNGENEFTEKAIKYYLK